MPPTNPKAAEKKPDTKPTTAPATATSAPAAGAPPAAPAKIDKRKIVSKERMEAVARSRHENGVVNSWLKRRNRPVDYSSRTESRAKKIAELEAILAAGRAPRMVPVFVNGVRTGKSVEKQTPLLPTAKLALAKELARLKSAAPAKPRKGPSEKKVELWSEFVRVLPGYMTRTGTSVDDLRSLGMSDDELKRAGVLK